MINVIWYNRGENMGDVEELRRLKTEYGYTDGKIAEMTGYSRSYINQMFNGVVPLNPGLYSNMIQLLRVVESPKDRIATVSRKTGETEITMELNIDGTGKWDIDTGIYMFDHLLSQIMKHGRFDFTLKASGDDPHHLIEDVAICLGKAFSDALGDRTGIIRMADATVPLDEALAMAVIDISGRPYSVLEMSFNNNDMAGFPSDMLRHFLETFAIEARINLHAHIIYGTNDHHRAEALFKALGRALDMAATIDERTKGISPSTKGMLEGTKK
jgi:imidazoleglycerol-phosphate dehydratase